MPDLSGQNIGRYHIIERLGEGGMATVYKAFDTRLERTVAIKFIRKEEVGQSRLALMLKRFEREARALAQLTHPNIVAVIDYGEYEDAPYLVMEYIQSGTLKARTGKPMPYQDAARLLAPIADALRYAHQHNTIHRDVKPANILIDESGHPMLSDFGIAKILGVDETTSLTGTNVGIGTPEYMAPEQWNNKVVPQTDMYSLGVVFYELVTGRKPYTADTPAAIAIKQATEPLKRPREFVANLPNEVEAVIFKALARDPLDRYADMAAFATALEKLSRGAAIGSAPQKEPIPEKRAYPPSVLPAVDKDSTTETPPEKIPVRAASNPWRWVALGLGGLVILAVVVWTFVLNKPKSAEPSPEIAQMQTSVVEVQSGKTQAVATATVTFPVTKITSQETIPVSLPSKPAKETTTTIDNFPWKEGKILFYDNFDNGKATNWSFDGFWKVVKDETNNFVLQREGSQYVEAKIFSNGNWRNYAFEARVKVIKPSTATVETFDVRFHSSGSSDYSWNMNETFLNLGKHPGWTPLHQNDYAYPINNWFKIRVEMVDNLIRGFVNEEQFVEVSDSNPLLEGGVGFGVFENAKIWFDDVKVIELINK